jgi:hypothetical protein
MINSALLVVWLAASSSPETPTWCATVKRPPVSLRAGPGRGFKVVTRLRSVELLRLTSGECRTESNELAACTDSKAWGFVAQVPRLDTKKPYTQGWVRLDLVQEVACPE